MGTFAFKLPDIGEGVVEGAHVEDKELDAAALEGGQYGRAEGTDERVEESPRRIGGRVQHRS